MKYVLFKTASATSKKNGLELFKNASKRNYLIDLSLIMDAEGIPEEFKKYARAEVRRDLGVNFDFSFLCYEISDNEWVNAKVYFKIYTVDTEEKK